MQVVFLLVLFAFKLTSHGSAASDHRHRYVREVQSQHVVQTFWEDPNGDGRLLHLTIDEQSGQKRVYIGGVNKIYQLSSDLKLEAHVVMGPQYDHEDCPVSTKKCTNVELKLTDYYNKALVIYTPSQNTNFNPLHPANYPAQSLPSISSPFSPISMQLSSSSRPSSSLLSQSSLQSTGPFETLSTNNNHQLFRSPLQPSQSPFFQQSSHQPTAYLISCGTLHQGICALHDLDNITNFEVPARESVVANTPSASTVAFIAPGPSKTSIQDNQVLYVGASYSNLGPYIADLPAISSRSLSPDSMFGFASDGVESGTSLAVNSLSRATFPIHYVYGFSSKGFSYFITVQKKATTEKPFVTKLVRVCQKDVDYHSYVEVQLVCRTAKDLHYNLAQAAYVGKPGRNLAESLSITTNDDVLYVAFAKSSDKRDVYNEPSQQSALCVYALPTIHQIFKQNIQHCFNGDGQQGLDFITRSAPCSRTSMVIPEDFCGMNVNHLINGIIPIEMSPVIEYDNVSLTAVAANPTNDFTVAFLGTSKGQLRRLVIEDAKKAKEYSSIQVDPDRESPINPDMRFDRRDKTAEFIYVMNDKRVSLIKVQECKLYKTCQDCVGADEPHCDWCSPENPCPVNLSYVNPRILSITPSKGPVSGGTKLLIWGLDMDAGLKVEAYVGIYPCHITARRQEVVECITSQADVAGAQQVSLRFDHGRRDFTDYTFLYVDDPEVEVVTSSLTPVNNSNSVEPIFGPPKSIPAGGISVHVLGKNFLRRMDEVPARFYVVVDKIKFNGTCAFVNSTYLSCTSPQVPEDRLHSLHSDEPIELDYGFFIDNVKSLHHLSSRPNNPLPKLLMYSNPEYKPFQEEVKYYGGEYLTINGSNLDTAASASDVIVRIGNSFCNVTSLTRTQLTCKPPVSKPEALNWRGQLDSSGMPDIIVNIGALNLTLGKMNYETYSIYFDGPLSRSILLLLLGGAGFLMLIVIIILIAYRRKASESNRVVKTMQEKMDVLEMKVASEAKQAFTELQTEMTDLYDDLEHVGIPYLDYRIYAIQVLFPNSNDHPVLKEMQLDPQIRDNVEKGLSSFRQLIHNKTFLLLFIRTLESNRYFSMRDRVNVASLIMVTLQGKMEYCTDILKTLLAELIEKSTESRSHPKLLLRRTESVAEKMLSSWFTFLLYKFLRECAGEPLFLLYRAIKHQVNKGPVDMISSEARCSLSEEKLIRQSIDYKAMTVHVSISPQIDYLTGVDLTIDNREIPLKVLDCDTISQVKDKAIDALYKSTPFSQRPQRDHMDLEWRTPPSYRMLLFDEDHTCKIQGYWKRLNTLAHYRVPDNATLTLIPKRSQTILTDYGKVVNGANGDKHRYETLNHFGFTKGSSLVATPIGQNEPALNDLDGNGYKLWHLVRHHDNDYRDGEHSGKMVSEIYLTRLLATKGTLQRFVDDLFETIFSTARLTSSLPIAIKYMFDFLDDQARGHGISDPEVVHTWKSNSLPLRFWVNLIKNPNFVFDINKSNIVDSCLSVVAQTFMDACSTSEHRLGKDSPSSKLLYAKDLPIYKDWVDRYYNEIAMMPPINEHDMNAMLAEESRQHAHEFNTNVSLNELFKYAIKYQEQLMITLEEDEFARKSMLAAKLHQTMLIMNGDTNVLAQAARQ